MTIPERYRKLRGALSVDKVSIGYGSIELLRSSELPSAQQGYANASGDWQPEWLVIGHEGLCGDPLFIDTEDDDSVRSSSASTGYLTAGATLSSWRGIRYRMGSESLL